MLQVPSAQRRTLLLLVHVTSSLPAQAKISQLREKLSELIESLQRKHYVSKDIQVAAAVAGPEVRAAFKGDPWFIDLFSPFASPDEGKSLGHSMERALAMASAWAAQFEMRGVPINSPIVLLVTDGKSADRWEEAARAVRTAKRNGAIDVIVIAEDGADQKVLGAFSGERPILAFDEDWNQGVINFFRDDSTLSTQSFVQNAGSIEQTFVSADGSQLDSVYLREQVLPLVDALETIADVLSLGTPLEPAVRLRSISQNSPIKITFDINQFFRDVFKALSPMQRRLNKVARAQELEAKDIELGMVRINLRKVQNDFEKSLLSSQDSEIASRVRRMQAEIQADELELKKRQIELEMRQLDMSHEIMDRVQEALASRKGRPFNRLETQQLMPALLKLMSSDFQSSALADREKERSKEPHMRSY